MKQKIGNTFLCICKNKMIPYIVLFLISFSVFYTLETREDNDRSVLEQEIEAYCADVYCTEFQLEEVRDNGNDTAISVDFFSYGFMEEPQLKVIEETYRRLAEFFFEEKKEIYGEKRLFLNFSYYGQQVTIGAITKDLDEVVVQTDVAISTKKVVEIFSDAVSLHIDELKYDSLEELECIEGLELLYSEQGYSYDEKMYLMENCSDCRLGQSPEATLEGSWQYEDTSEISAFMVDNIAKYTEQHTSCELYPWSEDVVMPIPAPGKDISVALGAESEEFLVAKGMSEEMWEAYVSTLSQRYVTEVAITESQEEKIIIFDMDNNIMAEMGWHPDSLCMYVNVMMFCQQKVSFYTNEEIADIVAEVEEIERNNIKVVMNVSSVNNLLENYDVYYFWIENKVQSANQLTRYLCVAEEGRILFWEEAKVQPGMPDEIEFFYENGENYMVMLTLTADGEQLIEIYADSGDFELKKRMKVAELDVVNNQGYLGLVTLEQEVEGIVLYTLETENGGKRYRKGVKLEGFVIECE